MSKVKSSSNEKLSAQRQTGPTAMVLPLHYIACKRFSMFTFFFFVHKKFTLGRTFMLVELCGSLARLQEGSFDVRP